MGAAIGRWLSTCLGLKCSPASAAHMAADEAGAAAAKPVYRGGFVTDYGNLILDVLWLRYRFGTEAEQQRLKQPVKQYR